MKDYDEPEAMQHSIPDYLLISELLGFGTGTVRPAALVRHGDRGEPPRTGESPARGRETA